MNKKSIYTLCLLIATALSLTSCLSDSDDSTYTLYNDTAITYFSLTAVNQFVTTKSTSGADSVYKRSVTTRPVFSIDHYKQQIFNISPLPANCDLEHVLASVSSKNNGVVTIKSLISDSLFYFSTTDSIDVSQPRILRVYASDDSSYRDYTVTVNMSEDVKEEMSWEEFAAGGEEIPAALYQDVVIQKWDVADGGDEGDTFKLAKDGGNTWTDEIIAEGEDASLLPEGGVTWVTFPYKGNAHTDYEIMAGTLESAANGFTFWRKIVEKTAEAPVAKWVNMPIEVNRMYQLPKMDCLSLVWFNSNLYAIGNNGKIYKSRDQGISWRTDEDITFPEDLESYNVKAVTDADGNLWLLNTDSGRVWRGSMSK